MKTFLIEVTIESFKSLKFLFLVM